MKISKDVRLLSAAMILCTLIISLSFLYQFRVEMERQNLVAAQKYVSQLQPGASVSSVESWLKAKNLIVVREENNAANPFAAVMFADAKLSNRNISFYLMAWSKNEPHSFDNPRHEFIFFFGHKNNLVKAVTWRIHARGISF